MRYRSAIPAPPRRFKRIPSWRRRKCTGETIAIITITTTIIVGTAGIITTIAIIITATGTGGKCDSLTAISSGPVSSRACLHSVAAMKSGEIAARYLNHLDLEQEFVMKSMIGAAFVAGALVVGLPGSDQSGRGSAAGEDTNRRHIRCDRFQRAALSPALLSPLRLLPPVRSPVLPALLLRTARLLPAVSLLCAGAVHLRHRVRAVRVVRRSAKIPATFSRALRSVHS